MTIYSLLGFAAVFAAAAALPGPAIAALLARVLGRGSGGIMWFGAGLVLGDLAWLAAALFGLAALAAAWQPLFALLRYAGAAYLLWLAWKLWRAPATPPAATTAVAEGPRSLFAALALGLGNPKTMLFYLALVPTVVPVAHVGPALFGELAAVIIVVYALVLAAYIALAARARRVFTSPRAIRRLNRGTGAVMAGAAVLVATRS